jgi:uncharacterized protein (TIGR02466 family)
MQIVNLFPTPIGAKEMDREITTEEHKFFDELERYRNVGNQSSVNSYILNEEPLHDLRKVFEIQLNEYFSQIFRPNTDVTPYITQSWLNWTTGNQWHHNHRHPNSFISGVYYVEAEEDDSITFTNPIHENWMLRFTTDTWTHYNSHDWWVPARKGTLLLFPSWLGHQVKNKKRDDNVSRISLAFNTFCKGMIGTEEDLTQLVIS